ncbi:MAG: hypothetical protein CM15mP49_26240 [Actinomycetota bacterium]|nr:MAG: hypothetical protein CM15mP49_26240 [Actinomycetota bacterium]
MERVEELGFVSLRSPPDAAIIQTDPKWERLMLTLSRETKYLYDGRALFFAKFSSLKTTWV